MDGNRRFVERRLSSFQEDIDILMQHTAEKQEPFASALACADSLADTVRGGRRLAQPKHPHVSLLHLDRGFTERAAII